MPPHTQHLAGNAIVESLSIVERKRLLARCEAVELLPGTTLAEVGRPFVYAWFPLIGLISQGAKLQRRSPLDMGLIGNDGMLGATIALGVDTAPLQAVVTGGGAALRISTPELRLLLDSEALLRQRIHHYLYIMLAQFARTAACNRFHPIGPRLARCLLIATDHASADRVHLTHETIAAMLGVRRSGITVAARGLRARGLIRYARGEIVILDREGMKAAACSCYADWPSQRYGITPT